MTLKLHEKNLFDEEVGRKPMYKTKDFSKFKLLPEGVNRPINEKHINNMVQALMETNFIEKNPIKVTEDFYILDGQHRFEALRKVSQYKDIFIYYEFDNRLTMSNVIAQNAGVLKWKVIDYINHFAACRVEGYVKLKSIIQKYSKLSIQVIFAGAGLSSEDMWRKIKSGTLHFSPKHVDDLYHIHFDQCLEIVDIIKQYKGDELTFIRTNMFQIALILFLKRPGTNFELFKTQLIKCLKRLKPCTKISEYQDDLETIYWYHRHQGK